MNRYDQKLLLLFIFLSAKMEKVFGLSSFRYKNKRIRALTLSTRVIIISFIILYPISCTRTLDFSHSNDSAVTIRARNLTFVFKWLLLCFIHGNGAFIQNYEFNDIERTMRGLIKRQNFNDNLMLLLRCTLKVAVIFSGLFFLNYRVMNMHSKKSLMVWEKVLALVLHLPLITFALASNRIYVANSIVKQLLLMNASGSKSNELQMKHFAIVHSRLHRFFTEFNKCNSINLLSVVCFCMLNIVYQVL
jgi:hypothetical protein